MTNTCYADLYVGSVRCVKETALAECKYSFLSGAWVSVRTAIAGGECREMADVERDVLNVNWLPAFADRERREIHSEQSIELPGPLDMAIIGIAGLASVTLVMLGLWKFVELVA